MPLDCAAEICESETLLGVAALFALVRFMVAGALEEAGGFAAAEELGEAAMGVLLAGAGEEAVEGALGSALADFFRLFVVEEGAAAVSAAAGAVLSLAVDLLLRVRLGLPVSAEALSEDFAFSVAEPDLPLCAAVALSASAALFFFLDFLDVVVEAAVLLSALSALAEALLFFDDFLELVVEALEFEADAEESLLASSALAFFFFLDLLEVVED